jgi:Zn-dependent peptidase ImmA (M78 family)
MSSAYYESLKLLARQKREQFCLTTKSINLTAIKGIYRAEGITIDLWELKPRIRAVYMCDEDDPSVLINKTLPPEPRLFALAHELKHHFCDRQQLQEGQIPCGKYNENREIEIGAEVFAAELIFPEAEFLTIARDMGLSSMAATPEDVVKFKRAAAAPVSYQFVQKRFEYFNLAPRGKFAKIKFTVLEEQMFGVPIYKQQWFKARRAKQAALKQRVS